MSESNPKLHVVLVEPEIAANAGAIGRSCVAVGAKLWLVRPLGFQLNDRQRKRAGLDYWDQLDWVVVDSIGEVAQTLGPQRLWSFTTKAQKTFFDAHYQIGDALVFGPESRGLPPSWLAQHPNQCVRIPMKPQNRSLNLANAASIALFEAVRQIGPEICGLV